MKNKFDFSTDYLVPSVQDSEPYTMGTNSTHYNSISLVPLEDEDYESLDSLTVYGDTGGEAAYDTPKSFGLIKKCIDAVMTTDDFEEWDSVETQTIEDDFTVWNSDGTALWTTDITINYCYCNMAIEANSLIVDGVEYHIATVAAISAFDAFSDVYSEGELTRTYIGTTINKVHLAELDEEDGQFIANIPRIIGFSNSTDVPGGYAIFNVEYILTIYENEDEDVIYKIQPIYINQPE